MGLREVVSEIVEDMEAESASDNQGSAWLSKYSYALKKALKASEGEPTGGNAHSNLQIPPEIQHVLEIQKAREEFKRGKERAEAEESLGGVLVEVISGDSGGTPECPSWHRMDPSVMEHVDRAHVLIGSQVYTLRSDKKLHLDEGMTKRHRAILESGGREKVE